MEKKLEQPSNLKMNSILCKPNVNSTNGTSVAHRETNLLPGQNHGIQGFHQEVPPEQFAAEVQESGSVRGGS